MKQLPTRQARIICNNFNKQNSNIKLIINIDPEKIARFYKTYDGIKEFLYIPPQEEIEDSIKNGAVYFCVMINGNLAGVAKASKLELPYPFFCVPKALDKEKDYWGLSGLYVHKLYRGKKLSTVLLKASTTLAEECGAEGIYADFDYRNIASMRLVSKYYNLLGYTDGRNGSPDEATIYTTFFKHFSQADKDAGNLSIRFDELDASVARKHLDETMETVGASSKHIVDYCGGFNEVVCFDQPYEFSGANIEITQDITKLISNNEISFDKQN